MPTNSNEALRAAKYCHARWNETGDINYFLAYSKLYWLGTAVPEADDLTEVASQLARTDALNTGGLDGSDDK